MADQPREQLGTWIFDGEPEHSVTPLMALKSQISNHQSQIIYEPGLAYSRDKSTKNFAKTIAAARQSDVILFFAGEEAILSGEARCRADITLPGAQSALLAELHKTGKPIVLIVMAGRPLAIGADVANADAVLYAFHGGTMAGPAITRVLTGEAPSGRLPMTFPKMVGQIPIYYNRLNTGRPTYDPPVLIDDIPVGAKQFSVGYSSCWLETATEPLFPFGYGLTYTTFTYGETQITNDQLPMTISCSITNTGNVDAYDVPQLYVRQMSGDFARPIAELKGFQKIFIPAGETRTVTYTISREDLGYWHEEKDGFNSRVWFATDDVPFHFCVAPHAGAVKF